MVAELLLHSLAEFESLLMAVLDKAGTVTTVEIGVEHGPLSAALIARAQRLGGRHIGIDPAPAAASRQLFMAEGVELLEQRSAAALASLPAMDVYFIDGDHNYATVSDELERIAAAANAAGRPFPLVVAHDIGWPWGRRDLYYDPAALDAGALHPLTFQQGVTLDNPATIQGGFRSEGRFAIALREGGPQNGVRTAIDDFLAARNLFLFEIPCIFGLGVIADQETAARIAPVLAPYHRNALLARMERNRLELYLRVIALQDELNGYRAAMQLAGTRRAMGQRS